MNRQVRGVAGALVMVFVLLGMFVWKPFGFLAFGVGFGLFFSALSNSCGMAMLLTRLPYNRSVTCDVRQVLVDIAATQDAQPGMAD